MKVKRIQRGIQSPHARVDGAAPLSGRMARMREHYSPGGHRSFWRSGTRGRVAMAMMASRRRMLLIWSVILSITTVVAIGAFMWFWLDSRDLQIAEEEAARAPENVRNVSKFSSPGETEALELVQRALALRNPAQVAGLFRLGESTPEQVVAFLVGSQAREGSVRKYDWLRSMDIDGLLIEGVLLSYDASHVKDARLALLTPDADGVWKLDFEAFARSSKPAWKELLDGRVDQAVVRVFVGRDAYFNGPFQDESQWDCYAIVSPELNDLLPDGHDALRSYCKVGSAQAKALARIFVPDVQTHRVTLQLGRVPGAEARQFEITRVLSEDWALPPVPFDAKFK